MILCVTVKIKYHTQVHFTPVFQKWEVFSDR